MKIGFIGLGAMGAPMTRRLAKAYAGNMLVYDVNAGIADQIAEETGAKAARSVAEIAGEADMLFSCVPDNRVLRQVYLSCESITSAIRSGSITIDCSTVGPDATREVHSAVGACGASHLDASMLGSVRQASEGTISFVVGGDRDAFDRAKSALANCGQLIRYCGESGAGNHMKLIHQTLVAGHAVNVAEAMGLCLETGADIETFYDIVTQGTGFAHSRYFENRVPRMRSGEFSPLFMLKFMLKDARLARDMVNEPERKFPALAAVIKSLEDSEAAGWGDADFSATMKAVEDRIGVRIDTEN